MNIGRAKIYPLTILAWVATFYMLVVGIHDWRLWLSVGFVFAERILVQLSLYLMMAALKMMAKNVQKVMQAAGIQPNE